MRSIIIWLFSVSIQLTAFTQSDMREGRHVLNFDVVLQRCDFEGKEDGGTPQRIPQNTVFSIRNISGSDYVIQVATFTAESQMAKTSNSLLVVNRAGLPYYFKLSRAQYDLNAQKFERRGNFTVGASTTLIKIRPGRKNPKDGYNIYSEFGNDFNIGVSAGWKVRPNRRLEVSHSVVGGLSFSSIKVTPYTTKEFLTAESAQGCLTFSVGYVFEYNKFQVSLFSGMDVMSGEVGRKWIYRNRPWIGVGFGFQIFRTEGPVNN